jgi:hypothetical protein
MKVHNEVQSLKCGALKFPPQHCQTRYYQEGGRGDDQKSLATFARVLYIVNYLGLTLPAPARQLGETPVGNIAFPLSPLSAGGGGDGPLHIYISSLGIMAMAEWP